MIHITCIAYTNHITHITYINYITYILELLISNLHEDELHQF